VLVPTDAVQFTLGLGTASLHIADQQMGDFTKVPNSLMRGPSVPATISYDVRWSGPGKPVSVNDVKNGFAGEFLENAATVSASATRQGFQFVSDPAATSKSVFAVLGRERNGVFFTSAAQVPAQIPAAMPATGAGGGALPSGDWAGLVTAGGLAALVVLARRRIAGREEEQIR
jgi:hypothetical protein